MTPINRLRNTFISLSAAILTLLPSCGDTKTYSDYQDDEEKAIERFINSRGITIAGSMPETDGEWLNSAGKEEYFLYTTGKAKGLYYHQVKKGDGDMYPQDNWTAYIRYVGYDMSGNMIYNCTAQYTPDPQCFRLNSKASDATFGQGFQQAVRNLRVGGKCKVIIPFNIGNSDNTTIKGNSTSDAGDYRTMYYEIELVGLE